MSSHANLVVNDIHSQLNPTRVAEIITVESLEAIQATVRKAAEQNQAISIAGGRHAMGAQQFGSDTILIDTIRLNRVLSFDESTGLIEVEAGIQWPKLIDYLVEMQKNVSWTQQWGIAQKQTGADRLSIGGSLSCNAHGRGLKMQPLVSDVECLTLVDAQGKFRRCSREENNDSVRVSQWRLWSFRCDLFSDITLNISAKIRASGRAHHSGPTTRSVRAANSGRFSLW